MASMTRETAYRVADDPGLRVVLWDLPLACCAMEVGAAIQRGLLVPEDMAEQSAEPADLNVLLVSGTVTHALAPAVVAAWERLPEPRAVLSFGSCANTGGPYWDAPSVLNGIDSLLPVAVYVPGCPPRPEGLIAGLRDLARSVAA